MSTKLQTSNSGSFTLISITKGLAFLAIFAGIVYYHIYDQNVECQFETNFRKLNLEGEIIEKKRDPANHSIPSIRIKSIKLKDTTEIYFLGDWSKIYDTLVVGQILIKPQNSLEVFILKSGEMVTLGKADFRCTKN